MLSKKNLFLKNDRRQANYTWTSSIKQPTKKPHTPYTGSPLKSEKSNYLV